MEQTALFEDISAEQAGRLTPEEQRKFIEIQQDIIKQQQVEIKKLTELAGKVGEQTFLLDNHYILLKNKVFGRSSEKSPRKNPNKRSKENRKRVLLPSERYPNIPIQDQEVQFVNPPDCRCCGVQLQDTGLTEDSEHLTVIPAKYLIILQRRHKYSCRNCHGDMKTAPVPPRIKPGSSYSDDMIIDASLSKYCDLLPMERYATIAGRAGLKDLPPHSLIEGSHSLANFLEPVYKKIKGNIQKSNELRADETPHRMLDKKSKGYLWGFSSPTACYFEVHASRAGNIAADFLSCCECSFLLTDAYSGYAKAVRIANEKRAKLGKEEIKNIYCNAHARRKFKDAIHTGSAEAEYFIRCYRRIYRLQKKPPDKLFPLEKIRKWQSLYFRLMKKYAENLQLYNLNKSSLGKAIYYFLNNYDELTLFMKYNLSIDNNAQERVLRNPVIGRKTWYGTNSPKGAKTASIIFTLVESCKLNNVNPRSYFKDLVAAIHSQKEGFTPFEYGQK